MKREGLESVLVEALDKIGVRALGHDQKVITDPDPGRDGFRIRLAMPLMWVDVRIDHADLLGARGPITVFDEIDRSKRALFAAVVDHIAKHDRSPLDRVRDIEAAAAALLDAMHVHLDDIRMPHGSSSAVLNAAYRLRVLVEAKPGAASWRTNGYGQDPSEVKVTP
jgi:hypothetical protein